LTTNLSTRRLTARWRASAFTVWFGLVSGKPPRQSSALPPAKPMLRAAPKCISGRTSYLRVRLAFHPYPQVIRAFCNRHRCGPPRGLTRASACPWIAHAVSGRFPATQHALFRLAFAAAPGTAPLASPPRINRRSVLQKVRRHGLPRSDCLWAPGFRISFTPRFRGAFHLSLTVLSTIGPFV
jgi:hypothetical protein